MVFGVAHVERGNEHGNRHQHAKNELRQVSEERLAITNRLPAHLADANSHNQLTRRTAKALNQINAVKQPKQRTGNKVVQVEQPIALCPPKR